MTTSSYSKATLHRAAWLAPVTSPLIKDGGVLVADGRIVGVGRFADLRQEVETSQIKDHGDRILTPALINGHCHLELSGLAAMGQDNSFFEPGDMTAWIEVLLNTRSQSTGSSAIDQALLQLHEGGVAVVADIGNLEQSASLGSGQSPEIRFFLEIMGLTPQACSEAKERLTGLDDFACTGHGPYSTAPELLVLLKERATARGDIFPIHLAESLDELEFLRTGQGRFQEFLDRRMASLSQGKGPGIAEVFTAPGCGPVQYLDDLGLLGPDTLCVHCVQVTDLEIDILAKRRAGVCLCPSSNRYLGVGKAPVGKLLAAGLTPCLGTDSLASNETLSIWHEMSVLAQEQEDLHPEDILRMATINGAKNLQIADRLGSLEKGKRAAILSVEMHGSEIFESLVQAGQDQDVRWVESGDE